MIQGPLVVKKVDLGSSFLRSSGISMQTKEKGMELMGECNVVYKGGASIQLFTEVYLNWPTKQFISVPVEASVTLSYASGKVRKIASMALICVADALKLRMHIPPTLKGRAAICFLRVPDTVFNTKVDVGGNARYNVTSLFPQITQFLQTAMQKLLWKTLVRHPPALLSALSGR